MIDEIRIGAMLIAEGTCIPESLVIGTVPYSAGWSVITSATRLQLGKDIEKAGWTFFFMAGQIYRTGFGFSDKARMDRAMGGVIDAVTEEKCNCLEISEVKRGAFLGIPYIAVGAHARHIQQSRSFNVLPSYSTKASEARSRAVASEAVQAWETKAACGSKLFRPPEPKHNRSTLVGGGEMRLNLRRRWNHEFSND